MLTAALEHLVKGLVDNPNEVQVISKTSPRGDILDKDKPVSGNLRE